MKNLQKIGVVLGAENFPSLDSNLPGCRIQFLKVSLFHSVVLVNMYIQHEGVSDTVYTTCVSLDGMEISPPTSTVWFVLLNSTFT